MSTALLTSARLIIADEPTPGMSLEQAEEALAMFRAMADEGKGVVLPEVGQQQAGHHHLGGDPLLSGLRRQSRQAVSGFVFIGFGQGVLDVPECICLAQKPCFQNHGFTPFVNSTSIFPIAWSEPQARTRVFFTTG